MKTALFVIQIEDKKLKINGKLEAFNLFLQTAFKIRRFSRKQLEQIKKKAVSHPWKKWGSFQYKVGILFRCASLHCLQLQAPTFCRRKWFVPWNHQ